MASECWACTRSIPGLAGVSLPRAPVGACWDCHVFGCVGHAEKDRASGKWLCLPSVANALAYSAGLDRHLEFPSRLTFRTVGNYRRRFPRTAVTVRNASSEGVTAVRGDDRIVVTAMDRERALALASEAGVERHSLLTEAILLGSILIPATSDELQALEGDDVAAPVVAEELATLLGGVQPHERHGVSSDDQVQ